MNRTRRPRMLDDRSVLGLKRRWPPRGHWIRGIMFADLVDFFAYELTVDPLGLTGRPLTELPRGKWVAFHRLATAIHGRASPAVIHAGNMGELLQEAMSKGRNLNGWMETLAAEATAAGGSFVVYQIGAPLAETLLRLRCWDGVARHNRFELEQRNLFEGLQRSGADLALLFLFNERRRTIPAVFPSLLGFAQGLTDTHHERRFPSVTSPFGCSMWWRGTETAVLLCRHSVQRWQSKYVRVRAPDPNASSCGSVGAEGHM